MTGRQRETAGLTTAPVDGSNQGLKRVDLERDTGGLPRSLVEAIEADGGLWWASDAYSTAERVVAETNHKGIRALRLDFRDLALLTSLPELRYLHIRSDGRPVLDPVGTLSRLRALLAATSALRGALDPVGFAELRWLHLGLGGKGGQELLPVLARGHPGLEWLSLSEVKGRRAVELSTGFPRLQVLRIYFADYLRELGPLANVNPNLETLSLNLTAIRSLDGLAGLSKLRTLEIFGGGVSDLAALAGLQSLRYLRLEAPDVESLEPLRGHPTLRMLVLNVGDRVDLTVLDSLPELVAVGWRRTHQPEPRWPNIFDLPPDHQLRTEWSNALRD